MYWVVSCVLGCILLGLVHCVWYTKRSAHYWRSKGVPFDTPLPLVGSYLRTFFGVKYFKLEEEWYKKHGRIFCVCGNGSTRLFISDPKILAKILVKDFHVFSERVGYGSSDVIVNNFMTTLTGDNWKRVRSITSPGFTLSKLKQAIPELCKCADSMTKNIVDFAENGKYLDFKRIFKGYVLDAIARSVYGTNLGIENQPENKFTENAGAIFDTDMHFRNIISMLLPKVAKLLKVEYLRTDAVHFFAELSEHIAKIRTKNNEHRKDVLQLLLDKLDQEQGGNVVLQSTTGLEEDRNGDAVTPPKDNEPRKSLTYEEFLAQCVFFFIAGFDTSSTILSMTAHFLALNPDCQEKVINEVDLYWNNHSVQSGQVLIDLEDLSALKYMDRVISETLRLAPPGARLERVAGDKYKLHEYGLTIPKGTVVCIPVYAMHRDPHLFPNPESFDPDRFLPENRENVQPYTYFPFGGGPRNCVGSQLALLIMKIGLLHLFRFFRLEPSSETKKEFEYHQGAEILQAKAVILKVLKRSEII